jgi:hypothetical protein
MSPRDYGCSPYEEDEEEGYTLGRWALQGCETFSRWIGLFLVALLLVMIVTQVWMSRSVPHETAEVSTWASR